MRIARYAVVLTLFSLIILSATFKIDDPDTLYYMAHGRYILQHGFSDAYSPFVYSAPDASVCFPEWLFHVMVYAAYAAGGWKGLVIFQALLVLVLFLVLFKHCADSGYSLFSTAFFMFLAVLIGMERFMLRADTFGLLLAVLFYAVLKRRMEKGFWALLFIQLLWANTHTSFPLGFVMIGAFGAGHLLEPLREGFVKRKPVVFPGRTLRFLGLLLIGCILVSLLNPYGLKSFLWPFRFLSGERLLHAQMEWVSPFRISHVQHLSVTVYKIFFFGSIALLAANIRRVKLIDLFILAPFFYLSAQAVRNLSLFAFFSACVLPGYLDGLTGRMRYFSKPARFLEPAAYLVLFLCIIKLDCGIISNEFYVRDQRPRRFGWGISDLVFPIKATEFIRQNGLPGRLFNGYGDGAYLDWMLFPRYQSFIDGHSYTAGSLDYYGKIIAGAVPYQDAAERYRINFFILNHTFNESLPLIARLYGDNRWVPVYFDELSVIFISDRPENKKIIGAYAIDFSKNIHFDPAAPLAAHQGADAALAHLNRGVFFDNLGFSEKAEYEFRQAVREDPRQYAAYINLGALYYRLSRYDSALEAYQACLKYKPDFAPAHFNLALVYQRKGMLDAAIREYEKAAALDPYATEAREVLERLKTR